MSHVHLPPSIYSAVTLIWHVQFCTIEEGPIGAQTSFQF